MWLNGTPAPRRPFLCLGIHGLTRRDEATTILRGDFGDYTFSNLQRLEIGIGHVVTNSFRSQKGLENGRSFGWQMVTVSLGDVGRLFCLPTSSSVGPSSGD